MKLGLLPARPADLARAPRLGAHPIARRTPQAALDRSAVPFRPQPFGNNTLSDCTAAGLGNAALAIGALGGFQPVVTEPAVESFYSATSGYIPGQPGTDRGAVLTDVLAYQARSGFHTGAELLTGPWATVDPFNRSLLALGMEMFGAVILGVALSLADMNRVGQLWDVGVMATGGDPTPGSGGLHCLLGWSYDGLTDGARVQLATWGGLQAATWRWLDRAIREAHVVAWRPLLSTAGVNWSGVDYDALVGEAAAFERGV